MDRREIIRAYKETPRPAGVFRVHNTALGKSLVGCSPNLPGMLNRQRFQLQNGSHPDRELQQDWHELGPEAFVFEVLDELKPSDDPGADQAEDLKVLKEMWLERMTAAGERLYPQSGWGR